MNLGPVLAGGVTKALTGSDMAADGVSSLLNSAADVVTKGPDEL